MTSMGHTLTWCWVQHSVSQVLCDKAILMGLLQGRRNRDLAARGGEQRRLLRRDGGRAGGYDGGAGAPKPRTGALWVGLSLAEWLHFCCHKLNGKTFGPGPGPHILRCCGQG